MIFNAGVFPCNRQTEGMTSSTSISVSFERKEMVILGTQYAGEMKKGVFTVMNYLMPLYPKRNRCSLKYTRQLIDAIHDGSLTNIEWEEMPVFGLMQPKTGIKDVPKEILRPQEAWTSSGKTAEEFDKTAKNLAGLFQKNFQDFASQCTPGVIAAGPKTG